ncbi:MAG: fasciclin domain-containing protein [Chloroflexota bacterium]
MTKHIVKLVTLLLSVLLVFSGTAVAQDELTIAEIVAESAEADEAEFTVLLQLLEVTDLTDTFADPDAEFMVFAPTDEAFQNLLSDDEADLEDLLEDIDALTEVLSYHVSEMVLTSEEFDDDTEIEMLTEQTVSVMLEDDVIVLNETVTVTAVDIIAANGVIHVIDAVLVPEEDLEPCFVSTDSSDTARVHVGPDSGRTAITFLDADVQYTVTGRNENDAGEVWYQLDKDEAAPGRPVNEVWVAASSVDSVGDCDEIEDTAAPPVITSSGQPASLTGTGSSSTSSSNTGTVGTTTDTNDTDNTGNAGSTGNTGTSSQPAGQSNTGVVPNSGTYTVSLAEFTNASCVTTSNVPIPSADVWTSLTFTVSVSASSTQMVFDGALLTFNNGSYSGQVTVDGIFVTVIVTPVSATSFGGAIIISFQSGGENCSGTTNFSAFQ